MPIFYGESVCVCACVLVTKLQISGRVIELGGMCTMSRTADSVRIPQSTTFLVVACNYRTSSKGLSLA